MKKIVILFSATISLCFCSCLRTGEMEDYKGCGAEGDAKRADVRELNREKNRYDFPDSSKIHKSITLASLLAPGDDRSRFTAGSSAEITGFVSDVKMGGDESCNCHATDPQDRDTHIELVPDRSDSGSTNCVIAEVTPRLRSIMADKGKDWSTATLRKTIIGRFIRVRGWLLFDEEHIRQATNTAPHNKSDWRATCWEVHPVTAIEIIK